MQVKLGQVSYWFYQTFRVWPKMRRNLHYTFKPWKLWWND